jgi:hypothetical protein
VLFYFTLFLLFFYFKLARVHKQGEKLTRLIYAQHILVAICAIALYTQGFQHYSMLSIGLSSFAFFIVSALMVAAVQLGIFVDGKPLIGISHLYKMMPFLAGVITLLSLFGSY